MLTYVCDVISKIFHISKHLHNIVTSERFLRNLCRFQENDQNYKSILVISVKFSEMLRSNLGIDHRRIYFHRKIN